MSLARCWNCQTPIVDYTSVLAAEGHLYCCGNCAAGHGAAPAQEQPTCAGCEALLVERSGTVERVGQLFCCYNCAAGASVLAVA
jgi:hypothetical protein